MIPFTKYEKLGPADSPGLSRRGPGWKERLGLGRSRKWNPPTFHPYLLIFTNISMVTLAITVELLLHFSNKNQGFAIPSGAAIWKLGGIQFLKSTLPSSSLIPLVLLWTKQDQWIRLTTPLIDLSNGNSPPARALTIDYTHMPLTLVAGIKNRHRLIWLSALVALVNLGLQPLAGALVVVRSLPKVSPIPLEIQQVSTLGLNPNFGDYTAFVAAAGYANAAVYHNLSDPPFVMGEWTIGSFALPTESNLNSSLAVPTIGIKTSLNCVSPDPSSLTLTSTPNVTLSATFSGCPLSVPIPLSADTTVYGVSSASPCKPGGVGDYVLSQIDFFKPVVFYFYNPSSSSSSAEAKAVYCGPTMSAFNVLATVNLTTSSLTSLSVQGEVGKGNNVTGPGVSGEGLNGVAFNGVLFNSSTDPFIQARATATQTGIPGTIFQLALRSSIQTAFGSDEIFLNATERVYTQHLSMIANSLYFLPFPSSTTTENGTLTSIETRLWIDTYPAHSLTVILLLTCFVSVYIYTHHAKISKNMIFFQQPGSIAFAAAISTSSGEGGQWAHLLDARDSVEKTREKLEGMKFGIDEGGHVVVQSVDRVIRNKPGSEDMETEPFVRMPDRDKNGAVSTHGRSSSYGYDDPFEDKSREMPKDGVIPWPSFSKSPPSTPYSAGGKYPLSSPPGSGGGYGGQTYPPSR